MMFVLHHTTRHCTDQHLSCHDRNCSRDTSGLSSLSGWNTRSNLHQREDDKEWDKCGSFCRGPQWFPLDTGRLPRGSGLCSRHPDHRAWAEQYRGPHTCSPRRPAESRSPSSPHSSRPRQYSPCSGRRGDLADTDTPGSHRHPHTRPRGRRLPPHRGELGCLQILDRKGAESPQMRESSATLISYFESTDFLNGNSRCAIHQI